MSPSRDRQEVTADSGEGVLHPLTSVKNPFAVLRPPHPPPRESPEARRDHRTPPGERAPEVCGGTSPGQRADSRTVRDKPDAEARCRLRARPGGRDTRRQRALVWSQPPLPAVLIGQAKPHVPGLGRLVRGVPDRPQQGPQPRVGACIARPRTPSPRRATRAKDATFTPVRRCPSAWAAASGPATVYVNTAHDVPLAGSALSGSQAPDRRSARVLVIARPPCACAVEFHVVRADAPEVAYSGLAITPVTCWRVRPRRRIRRHAERSRRGGTGGVRTACRRRCRGTSVRRGQSGGGKRGCGS